MLRCPNCGAGEDELIARLLVHEFRDYNIAGGIVDSSYSSRRRDNSGWSLLCSKCDLKIPATYDSAYGRIIFKKEEVSLRRDIG